MKNKNFFKKINTKTAATIIISLVLIFVAYINFPHRQEFQLDVGKDGDSSTVKKFFLDPGFLSPRYIDQSNKTYRAFNNAAAYVIFNPQYPLGEDQTIKFTAIVKANTDLILSLKCPACEKLIANPDKKKIPVSKVFLPMYLHNYSKVNSFGNTHIYALREIAETKSFTEAASLREWLSKNALANNYTVNTLDFDLADSKELAKQNVDTTLRSINIGLRGDATFLTYFTDKIDLTVSKEDLNWYDNKDDVKVSILTLDGKEIASEIIEDTTDGTNEANKIQQAHFQIDNVAEGAYNIKVEGLELHKDFIIHNITLNSNKLITKGQINIAHYLKLYYQARDPFYVNLRGWTLGHTQTLFVNNYLKAGEITEEDLGSWKQISLPSGNNDLLIPTGGYLNTGEQNFSFTPETYFDLNNFRLNETDNPDLIISTLDYQKDDHGWTNISKTFKVRALLDDWGIEEDQLRKVKKLSAAFFTPKATESFAFMNVLEQEGYKHIISYEDTHLFSNKFTKPVSIADYELYPSLAEWIKSNILPFTSIGTQNFEPNKNAFANTKVNYEAKTTYIDFPFRSNTQLAAYFKDSINLNSSTNSVYAKIFDSNNELIIEDYLPIQQNIIKEGIYYIDLNQTPYERIIESLSVNSNKVVFLDHLEVAGKANLFVNEPENQDIRFKIQSLSDRQTLTINDDQYTIDNTNLDQWIYSFLEKNDYEISTEKGIILDVNYISPSKDSFFIPSLYKFEEKSNQDNLVIKQETPQIFLDFVSIEID